MRKSRIVLISGSRDASDKLLNRVRGGVARVHWNRDELIVGDAEGVDAYVVNLAQKMKIPYMAYGINTRARNGAKRYSGIRHLIKVEHFRNPRSPYTMRDRYMVDRALVVLCFWNEQSSGTLNVFKYACEVGKDAYLIGEDGVMETSMSLLNAGQASPVWEMDLEEVEA